MQTLQKSVRIKDEKLLAEIRKLPCLVNNKDCCGVVHAAHITPRGSGGGDTPDNAWPNCAVHHDAWHRLGMVAFVYKHYAALEFLVKHSRYDIINKCKYFLKGEQKKIFELELEELEKKYAG